MGIFYFEMSREIHIKLGCLLHKNFLNGKTVVNKYKNKIKWPKNIFWVEGSKPDVFKHLHGLAVGRGLKPILLWKQIEKQNLSLTFTKMKIFWFQIAVQDTFNEQEGNPSVYRERPPEPRTPPMNLQPSDQRFVIMPWFSYISIQQEYNHSV